MKRLNLYISAFSMLFSLSVLMACDEEENLFGNRDTSAGMYELSVTSAGFVPAEEQPSEGAETINIPFGNDDAIGLVMVDGEKITHTRYIYKELLSKWSGDLVVKNRSAKIYAYYPYNEALEISSLNTQGTNAAEFFSQMITDFVPQADQSKEEDFRKSNLMVGTASLDETGKKISINMEHAMALAMVAPGDGGLMYLDTDPNYTWELKGSDLNTLSPFYKLNEKDFVRFVLPETEVDINTVSGNVKVTPINRTQYKKFSMSLVHTLQIGDFYMRDGSLVGKDAELTDEQKANCIGIVFQTDENRIGQAEKEALGGKAHGLVMALKNESSSVAASVSKFNWGKVPSVQEKEISAIAQTKKTCYNDISGLQNCQEIWAKLEGADADNYKPFRYAKDFSTQVEISASTTGWFLPSIGQLWDIFRNLGGCVFLDSQSELNDKVNITWKPLPDGKKDLMVRMNEQLDKVGDEYIDRIGDRGSFEAFWTSSEFSYDYVIYTLFNNTELNITARPKTEVRDSRVRCILAF